MNQFSIMRIRLIAIIAQLLTTWRVFVMSGYIAASNLLWQKFADMQIVEKINLNTLMNPDFLFPLLLHIIAILLAIIVFLALMKAFSRPTNKTEYETAFVEHGIITKNGICPSLLSYKKRKKDGIITMIFYTAGLTGIFINRRGDIEEYLDISIQGDIEYIGKSRHIIRIRATEGTAKPDRGLLYED